MLLWRSACIQKLGNGGDKLPSRKRLGQKDAVWNTPRTIFVRSRAGYVNNRKFRVDLSGALGNFPTVHRAQQINVSYKCAVFGQASHQQGHRLFARCGDSRFKTAINKSFFNKALNRVVILTTMITGNSSTPQTPILHRDVAASDSKFGIGCPVAAGWFRDQHPALEESYSTHQLEI